jgi:hypothetical protein
MNEKQWTILEKLQVLDCKTFTSWQRREPNRSSVLQLSLRGKFKATQGRYYRILK